jgi:subtilase family serine protease
MFWRTAAYFVRLPPIMRRLVLAPRILGVVLGFALFADFAWAVPRQILRGHVPSAVAGLVAVDQVPGGQRLNVAVTLPLRDARHLTKLLQDLYDPASPNYHHYLTPGQFTDQFGPTADDYQALIQFAQSNGLTVSATFPNRTVLDLALSAADVRRVLHVTLRRYRHPAENRLFYAPDGEPSVDLAAPLLRIEGLDNYVRPRPLIRASAPSRSSRLIGSATNGDYGGPDFRAAYAPGVTLDGTGQTLALFENDGYFSNDIVQYETNFALPNVPLTNVLVDGFTGPSGGEAVGEVSLDIEMAISMAPGLARIMVYESPGADSADEVNLLNQIVSDNAAAQISSGWVWAGSPSFDQIYLQMAAQGQSMFQACGDEGAYNWTNAAQIQREDSPFETLVGGTTLTTTGPVGGWVSESAWNADNGTNGTGGGISPTYPLPSWQSGISMSPNGGSTSYRNVPDVAMTGNNVWIVYDNGTTESVGGTSCAAPLWAAFTALINQRNASLGLPAAGFINPAVYALGRSSNYTATFHDITNGNNTTLISPDQFFAVPGFDLCTGWGTPTGSNLINALTATPDPLRMTPPGGIEFTIRSGSLASANSQTFTLTNIGAESVKWAFAPGVPWLSAAPATGLLHPGGPAQAVTVSLSPAATNLAPGTYLGALWLTNKTYVIVQSRDVLLAVGAEVLNGGFEMGDFTDWTLLGGTQDGGTTLTWTAQAGLAYQLQYKTSLSSGSWLNSGAVIEATKGTVVTATDPASGDASRFYRVQLLP